jgi:ATP-dependent helicase/nuclease subunit A
MDEATLRQVQAAEPAASTWLSANAGSGKTRVLTDRVARLLLRGVPPQRILCLTYTKAAAAEMQNRLFRGWANGRCWTTRLVARSVALGESGRPTRPARPRAPALRPCASKRPAG